MRVKYGYGSTADSEQHPVPSLVGVQLRGWERFLHSHNTAGWTLHGAFARHFPITDPSHSFTLDFLKVDLGDPPHSPDYCKRHGLTYQAPVSITLHLTSWMFTESGDLRVREVLEKKLQLGDMPMMTNEGLFIVNGGYRTCLSQLRKCPGFYCIKSDKKGANSKAIIARVIPERGTWATLTAETQTTKAKGLAVRFDTRRAYNFVTFLRACGYTKHQIVKFLAVGAEPATFDGEIWHIPRKSGLSKSLRKHISSEFRRMDPVPLVSAWPLDPLGACMLVDPVTFESGSVIAEPGETLLSVLNPPAPGEYLVAPAHLNEALMQACRTDVSDDSDGAAIRIARLLRPGVSPTFTEAKKAINSLLRQQELGTIGRLRMNFRFRRNAPIKTTAMTPEDYLLIGRYLCEITCGEERGYFTSSDDTMVTLVTDELDDLANRRLRTTGEIVGRHVSIVLSRMMRDVRVKLHGLAVTGEVDSQPDVGAIFPAGRWSGRIREFFMSDELIQMTDDVNPLAELEHKRRITLLGPGGLSRENANMGIRDVHTSQFGRICPISTPEGPNVGLVSSLAMYAQIEENSGLIAAPYLYHNSGKVHWLTANEESGTVISEFGQKPEGDRPVGVRLKGTYAARLPEDITHSPIHPSQPVSVSSACIPFCGHDDANRALMGSNMQRQAVPPIRPAAPIVGTGVEAMVCESSVQNVVADVDGTVAFADATFILVEKVTSDDAHVLRGGEDDTFRMYRLNRGGRSNSGTAVFQIPRVRAGDVVKRGDILADGPGSVGGEMALGQNLLAAYMIWDGYNFEDAFVISERVVRDGLFTTVHVQEMVCEARKLANLTRPEEITRDLPNVSEAALANLDDDGIIQIGVEVKPGDILVGKVSPKPAEMENDSVNNLLAAIFDERHIFPVRNDPLICPAEVHGVVTNVRVVERDEQHSTIRVVRDFEIDVINQRRCAMVKAVESSAKRKLDKTTGNSEQKIIHAWRRKAIRHIEEGCKREIEMITPDDMSAGTLQRVVVTVTSRHPLEVGDKLALRHGNKGVIAKIESLESMPRLADGTPVDILINPLGVPSRMNVGQLFEASFGYGLWAMGRKVAQAAEDGASREDLLRLLRPVYRRDAGAWRQLQRWAFREPAKLREYCLGLKNGIQAATPAFRGATEADIAELFELSGASPQEIMYDGRDGRPFDRKITIGLMHVLKLHHMVGHKLHARSTGPYTMVTQQPLGGRAHSGGQRLGEMEVWAMEAYGAAYTLQEFMTIKSDSIDGRRRAFDDIVDGKPAQVQGMPASTELMIHELRALGLSVELLALEDEELADSPEQKKVQRTEKTEKIKRIAARYRKLKGEGTLL